MKKGETGKWELEGFLFTDEAQAKQAEKELEGMKYIKSNMDVNNPDMVLDLYNKIVEEGMFQSPPGYSFLKEMQEYLTTIPYIMNHKIQPIRVKTDPVVTQEKENEARQLRAEQRKKEEQQEQKKVRKKEQKEKRQAVEKNVDYKKRFGILGTVVIAMAVMLLAMFAITLTSGNTTILNYENKIINKYEQWEQELEQREAELDERESALQP